MANTTNHESAAGAACTEGPESFCTECGVDMSHCEICDGVGYHRAGCRESDDTVQPRPTKYDSMTGEQLARLPARGAVMRAAYGVAGNRTDAQEANWRRVLEYNRSRPGGLPGVGKLWNS